MRADANKIAFRAIRHIIEGAKPFEVEVAGTKVTCAVSRGATPPWPERGVQARAGGRRALARARGCRVPLGRRALQPPSAERALAQRAVPAPDRPRGPVLRSTSNGGNCRLRDRAQTLVWITLPPIIGDLEDSMSAKIQASVSTFKRKKDVDPELGNRLNTAMRKLLHESGLPLVAGSTAEVCAIEVP